MTPGPQACIAEHFRRVKDPRRHRVDHLLVEIITIAICAVICGADSWIEVEEFCKARKDWLQTVLVLPNGGRCLATLCSPTPRSTGSRTTVTPSPFAVKIIASVSAERRSPASLQPRPLPLDFSFYQPASHR